MDEEGRLRRAFARLREEERLATPPFDHVMSRRRARTPSDRRRLGALGLAGAAAVIVSLTFAGPRLGRLLTSGGDTGSLAVELQRTATMWRSPTDFLLEQPHARAWRRIPAIGRPLRLTVPGDPPVRDRTDDIDPADPGRTPS